jgi:hypothetical protein
MSLLGAGSGTIVDRIISVHNQLETAKYLAGTPLYAPALHSVLSLSHGNISCLVYHNII